MLEKSLDQEHDVQHTPYKTPLVSVIMVVQSNKSYAIDSIRSMIRQAYTNWEMLIFSKDISALGKPSLLFLGDPRIRYFEYEAKDISGAQNIGLKKMKGGYFCFLRAGDVLPRHSIDVRMQIFLNDPSVEFVDGHTTIYDESLTKMLHTKKVAYQGQPLRALARLSARCFVGTTWLISRKKHRNYHVPTTSTYASELQFYTSLSDKGVYTFVDDVVLHHRMLLNGSVNEKRLVTEYKALYARAKKRNPTKIYCVDRLVFHYRIRKIITPMLLAKGKWKKGLYFLLTTAIR